MGGLHEQPASASRGSDFERADLQLEIVATEQISLFPSEQEQIKNIEDRLVARTEDLDGLDGTLATISFAQEEINHALRKGTGFVDGKLRVYDLYQKNLSSKEIARVIKAEYGHGGSTHYYLDGRRGWLDCEPSKGLLLSVNGFADKFQISWTDVEKYIELLIYADNYLTDDEKAKYEEQKLEKAGIEENLHSKVETTPSFQTYLDIKNEYQNTLVLYPLGDFFEAFNDDAKFMADELELALVSREVKGFEERVPMIGIPSHSKENYISKLHDLGKDVVLVNDENGVKVPTLLKAPVKEEIEQPLQEVKAENFHITDDNLGVASKAEKIVYNLEAIRTLKMLEKGDRYATNSEKITLSRYVGWGGLSEIFEETNTNYLLLKSTLDEDEYAKARASVLNAHYTSPTIIKTIYDAVEKMGFTTGNILDQITTDMIQSPQLISINKNCISAVN
ncbi:MAG: hypothetical protein R3Y09_10630 [Clostridia bacterium]